MAVFAPSGYGYGFDIDIGARAADPLWRQLRRRLSFLRRAADAYDVFHFNFGQTILSIRRFGRVVDEHPGMEPHGECAKLFERPHELSLTAFDALGGSFATN